MAERSGQRPASVTGPRRATAWALIAICGGTFMLLVDVTIVQVALPRIQRELHASFTDLQWVIDAYALTLSALILTSGTLADRIGRKRVFIGGLTLFTLASLLCGLSGNASFLILARGVQGIGGAAMFATSLALIAQEFPGPERAGAIAAWGATVGGAVAVGPLIGGVLTDGLGWQWIFFVNIPIGLATIAISAKRMVNVRDPEAERLDWLGLVTFSGALFLLIFGLLRGSDVGWGSTLIVCALAGAVRPAGGVPGGRAASAAPDVRPFAVSQPGFLWGVACHLRRRGGDVRDVPLHNLLSAERPRLLATAGWPAPAAGDVADIRRAAGHARPCGSGRAEGAAGRRPRPDRARTRHDARADPRLDLDRAPAGTAADRGGHRAGESGDREHRPRRRARRAQRHGLRHQQHVPHRRARRGGGGARGDLPASSAEHLQSSLGGNQSELAKAVASGGTRAAAGLAHGRPDIVELAVRAFVNGMNTIFLVGAVLVLVGAVGAVSLVRLRDFHRRPAPAPSAVPEG